MAESFSKAFAAARKKLGPGKTFEWNGKKYTTDYKEEVGKGKASTTPRPKARPEGMAAKPKANPVAKAGPEVRGKTNPMASSPRPKANPGQIALRRSASRAGYKAGKRD